MKKILIFTDYFLPGFKGGGPITSISNLANLLNSYFDILICTKNHDFGDKNPYDCIEPNKITSYKNYKVIYLSNMNILNIFKTINNFNPDIVYLNSFFSKTTQTVILLNKLFFKKKLIIAPRGELQSNALNIKKTKKYIYLFIFKLFAFYKNIYFHSTDISESKSIKEIFSTSKIIQLPNIVKIYHFSPLSKKENELKLVFVSRISKKKNLHYALKILKNIDFDISFDIYGPKEDLNYWEYCQKIINDLPKNIKVEYKGSLNQNEIINTLRKYHAFLFPTLSENFGHIIVEAMQSGLIPIISDQTPWRNLNKYNAGWDIPLDREKLFINTIKELYYMNNEEYTKKSLAIIQYIHSNLNIDALKKDYIEFFNNIIGEK